MAICVGCAEAGDTNRELFNAGEEAFFPHPSNCGCDCQHSPTVEWEKYFLVKEPKRDSVS